ncbi:MAG: acylphosphatase [Saprospiraceae bacterium]
MLTARRWLVRGKVQGVGFRYFTQREAIALGVTGWVRNLDDGRVEVFGQGIEAAVDTLQGRLWQGPHWAEVRHVEVVEASLEGNRSSFNIL